MGARQANEVSVEYDGGNKLIPINANFSPKLCCRVILNLTVVIFVELKSEFISNSISSDEVRPRKVKAWNGFLKEKIPQSSAFIIL